MIIVADDAFMTFLFRGPSICLDFLWVTGVHLSGSVVTWVRRLTSGKMVTTFGSHDWRDRKVRDSLLLLLSFAVTREPADLAAALAVADELGSLGGGGKRRAPSFFLRTSNEVCEAILAAGDGHDVTDGDDNAVLRRHVARIEDPRLRRAFEAAVGLRQTSEPQQESAEKQEAKGPGFVKGLLKK
jgi:hypothetical protein